MERLKQFIISELRKSREELLNVPVEKITCSIINDWFKKHEAGFGRADELTDTIFGTNIHLLLSKYKDEVPNEIVQDLRDRIISITDEAILVVDEKQVVLPILDELILKIKDVKLATLLNEFNRCKDANPNLAAISFRTILTIIIQERAKLVVPTSKLSVKNDLGFEPDIITALESHIFASAEEKLLKRYLNGGNKDTCDNVAHKPGENTLVNKDDLSETVNLLNRLLSTITI